MFRSKILAIQFNNLHRISKRLINDAQYKPPLGRLSVCESDQVVSLDYQNRLMHFPVIWLRDNCQCSHCFDSSTYSRIINWYNFDVHPKLSSMVWNDETKKISIKWEDNHESTFELKWLQERDFSPKNQEQHLIKKYRPARKPWTKENFSSTFLSFDYTDVVNTNEGLKNWLESLSVYGVAKITNTPKDEGSCRKVANRVGFIKKTHFGEEFIVKHKPGTTSFAYLSSELQMHTDSPYYEHKPGVNLLHCLEQSNSPGGENLLIDAMNISKMMKDMYPEQYKLLKTLPVDWVEFGRENNEIFHCMYRSPVFVVDDKDELIRVNQSITQRGSHFTIPLDLIKPWYEAYDVFVKLMKVEAVKFKTKSGDILTFDNIRLVHGRSAYDDTQSNIRYIVGAYLDWDLIFSRLRVLNAIK